MSARAAHAELIDQARHVFADLLTNEATALLEAVMEGAYQRAEQPAERAVAQLRQDLVQSLRRDGEAWIKTMVDRVQALAAPAAVIDTASSALVSSLTAQRGDLSLVDDETMRLGISVSRLAQAIVDRSSWELNDLRARVMQATGLPDLAEDDLLRPQSLARCLIRSWQKAGLGLDAWQELESVLHRVLARRAEEAYHETNRWLIERGVMPEIDLRPFIRRSDGSSTQHSTLDETPAVRPARAPATPPSAEAAGSPEAWRRLFPAGAAPGVAAAPASAAWTAATGRGGSGSAGGLAGAASGHGTSGGGMGASGVGGAGGSGYAGGAYGAAGAGGAGSGGASGPGGGGGGGGDGRPSGRGEVTGWSGGAATGRASWYGEETRMMTRQAGGAPVRADVVLEEFGQIMDRHLPGFRDADQAKPASEQLSAAMARAQAQLAQQVDAPEVTQGGSPVPVAPEQVLRDLRERHQQLKQAAATPAERATIELVALLFQSILTEDRIPATVRVWFARLQMPVLRVAVAEPDFFSAEDHPARRLIDRMGACVMGFEGGAETVGPALEAEIKRIVQVVEAFPDTGRRVFQTVLNEFEKFLETYYADGDATTRMGISLAQQVEQRETLAIQFTIELRKMLNEVPVQEGVREFLFHIWADVLATTAVRHGPQSPEVRQVREAATELLWTASAKTTREERAEVIRRLPPLLVTLRQGMSAAGMAMQKQEEAIKALNLALTAAFGARAVTVTNEQLDMLKERLETIEEMIPDDDFEIDDSWVLDETTHARDGLEVVSEGGSMPGPSMVEWAMQLRLGDAFTLDLHGRQDVVRLVWQGMHRQLSLFVTGAGRCVLFQKARLAAYLQAGLLLPMQEESLTVSATRDAMRKIQADPARLM